MTGAEIRIRRVWVLPSSTGEGMRSLRLAARLQAIEVAAEMGVSPGAVSLWENGKRKGWQETAARYEAAIQRLKLREERSLAGAATAGEGG